MADLKGKVAIVTGGGQGVGKGIAMAMAKAGATVAITGRTERTLKAVLAEIEATGTKGSYDIADGNDAGAIDKTVDAIAKRFGRIDILINNAQQVPLGRLLDVKDEDFLAGFTSGPLATLRYMRACYPHLKAAGDGVIFNFSSSATQRWDMAGYGAYGAVKEAIRQITRAAAAEFGPDNIRTFTIAPHADSEALKGWIESRPEEAKAFFQTIPLRRIGRCEEDIGAALVGLCGPEFSYLTGTTIPLDGGQSNFD